MRTGTNHFVSRAFANLYYRGYGYTPADVTEKIADGEIKIGFPRKPDGYMYSDKDVSIDSDGRYWVQS